MELKYLFLMCGLFVSLGAESAHYKFLPESGHVTFLAKGRPALISIKGEGVGLSGVLHEINGQVSGEIDFDLKGLKTGIDLRDDHLKNKYLEIEKFPKATLVISSLSLPIETKDSFQFSGVLNLHGVSQPVDGRVEVLRGSTPHRVKSEFKIKLSQFKIETPSFQGVTVAEEVLIKVDAPVLKSE